MSASNRAKGAPRRRAVRQAEDAAADYLQSHAVSPSPTDPFSSLIADAVRGVVRQELAAFAAELAPAQARASGLDKDLDVSEGARALGISERGLRRWIARGHIRVLRLGGRIRIRRSEIERVKQEAES